MIQDQLIDYISSQLKLGVSRDAIKSALVSAGWATGDVEDTLKKAEDNKSVAIGTGSSSRPMSVEVKKPDMQTIRVSDLVSTSSAMPASSMADTKSTTSTTKTVTKTETNFGGKISGNNFENTTAPKKKTGLIVSIIGGILIVVLAGAAIFLYLQNQGLSTQVTGLTSQSTSVNSQLTSLQAQFTASSTGLSTEVSSLTAANNDLELNLSFYAVPIGGSTSSTPVTISGSLSGGGKAPYAFTTPRGAKIFVLNSSDASISAQLKPLVGQTVQFTGTYIPGSDQMTVVSIVGPPVTATATPAPAATSTTSTNASGTTATASSSPATQ